MTALFFIYLAVVQAAIGVAGVLLGLLFSMPARSRAFRGRLVGLSVGVAAGGVLGAVAGFLFVIATALAWAVAARIHVLARDSTMSEGVFLALPTGYFSGLAVGAAAGWRCGRQADTGGVERN